MAKICHPAVINQHECEWTPPSSDVNSKQLKVHELQCPELRADTLEITLGTGAAIVSQYGMKITDNVASAESRAMLCVALSCRGFFFPSKLAIA